MSKIDWIIPLEAIDEAVGPEWRVVLWAKEGPGAGRGNGISYWWGKLSRAMPHLEFRAELRREGRVALESRRRDDNCEVVHTPFNSRGPRPWCVVTYNGKYVCECDDTVARLLRRALESKTLILPEEYYANAK